MHDGISDHNAFGRTGRGSWRERSGEYIQRLTICKRRIGQKIWYFTHHAIQTPSLGTNLFACALIKERGYN
jgi:hypothetical protein